MTADEAFTAAGRVLKVAEGETNLPLMERLERLADSYIALGRAISEHVRVNG